MVNVTAISSVTYPTRTMDREFTSGTIASTCLAVPNVVKNCQ
jgi:hypothetical protein